MGVQDQVNRARMGDTHRQPISRVFERAGEFLEANAAHDSWFVWDPRSGVSGQRHRSLVQPAIDIPPTVLGAFGLEPARDMTGRNLAPTVAGDKAIRETGIFGMFGAHVNITDGRYVYMRGNGTPGRNEPLKEYTLMPTNMRRAFSTDRFREPIESTTFSFTKGCHVMRVPSGGGMPGGESMRRGFEHLLFDLEADPGQEKPIADPAVEERLSEAFREELRRIDAPPEQWIRLGL